MLSEVYCEPRSRTQLDVLRDVMLLAARHEAWMTLEELARKTHFAPASISAQLRHLRKAEHGGFMVAKRRREAEEMARESRRERVWEYQVGFGINEVKN